MEDVALLLVGAAFANNVVLVKLLGVCPVTGATSRLDAATGLALATGFAMTLASALAWIVDHWLLAPLGLAHLRTLAFLLVIAAVVQFTELALHRRDPALYRLLGLWLPLIAANCAVLGVTLLNVQARPSLFAAVLHGVGAAAGFGVVLVLFAALRERLEGADVPDAWRGAPIALVTAGLMSLAFHGFAGMAPAP